MAKQLKRVFDFDGKKLSDPNPDFTIEQVVHFYSAQYPQIVSSVPTQTLTDGIIEVKLEGKVGTLG